MHAILLEKNIDTEELTFQYRKRYKGACNHPRSFCNDYYWCWFQYRKRYKGACNAVKDMDESTAKYMFQYRKRYKGACNSGDIQPWTSLHVWFQYRKRYKGACNKERRTLGCCKQDRCFNTVNGIRVHAIGCVRRSL